MSRGTYQGLRLCLTLRLIFLLQVNRNLELVELISEYLEKDKSQLDPKGFRALQSNVSCPKTVETANIVIGERVSRFRRRLWPVRCLSADLYG